MVYPVLKLYKIACHYCPSLFNINALNKKMFKTLKTQSLFQKGSKIMSFEFKILTVCQDSKDLPRR